MRKALLVLGLLALGGCQLEGPLTITSLAEVSPLNGRWLGEAPTRDGGRVAVDLNLRELATGGVEGAGLVYYDTEGFRVNVTGAYKHPSVDLAFPVGPVRWTVEASRVTADTLRGPLCGFGGGVCRDITLTRQ